MPKADTKNHFFQLPYPTLWHSNKSRGSVSCVCLLLLFDVTLSFSQYYKPFFYVMSPLTLWLWISHFPSTSYDLRMKNWKNFTNINQTIATYCSKAEMFLNCLQPVNHVWPPLCFLSVKGSCSRTQQSRSNWITCANDMQANSDCKK